MMGGMMTIARAWTAGTRMGHSGWAVVFHPLMIGGNAALMLTSPRIFARDGGDMDEELPRSAIRVGPCLVRPSLARDLVGLERDAGEYVLVTRGQRK